MFKIIEYIKNNWRMSAAIAGGVLLVLSVASFLLLASMRRDSVAKSSSSNDNTNAAAALPTAHIYTDLYAVSIDNHADALPISGVSKAVIVYEAPVEGDITRLLAVFERATMVPEIGPVRSARPYFLDWVSELGPSLFLHFGGSPEALARITATASLKEVDRDGISNTGNGFWRDDTREAPHNTYTSSDNAEKMFATRGGAARTVTAWLMAGDPDPSARGAGGSFTVPLSTSVYYQPEWRYDSAKNVYVRYLRGNGKQELTRDGEAIEAKNVIVTQTDIKTVDGVGRLKITTAGQGHATVYRNGEKIDGTWNAVAGSLTRFYGGNGNEIAFTEGNVWIEVVKK